MNSAVSPLPSDAPDTPAETRYAKNRLVLFGGLTAAIAALCCFTLLLVWGLLTLGLTRLVAYIDLALLPLLAVGLLVLYVGVQRVRRARAACDDRCAAPSRSASTR